MAIGAHELLLIVRAQNQAAGLLGRVSRDFRRLQNMKSLDIARSRAVNQMASNAVQMQQKLTRIGSVVNAQGKLRLEHEQAVARSLLRQTDLEGKLKNLRKLGASGTWSRQYAKLNEQLVIEKRQMDLINSRWRQNIALTERESAAMQVLIQQNKILRDVLLQIDAEMAAQKGLRTETMIRATGHVGRVLASVGLIGVAAFGAMGVSAAHFNQEATRAATQTGAIGSNANVVVANATKIQKAVLGIMTVVPANQNDLTDALYNIYSSMNLTFGQGTKLLKLFGQVWVAGGMTGTINEVADALITLGNNWKISASNMAEWDKLAASTLATVRFGRFTIQQYTQTMNQLAPAFHGAHQSIEQMNAAIAFNTKLIPSQRMAAAGLARFIEQLQRFAANPKPGFEQLAKDITTTTGNLKPLNQVIEIILQKMPKLKTSGIALTNFFKTISGAQGTIQARRAAQALFENLGLYQKTLRQTSGDQKEFNRSLAAMQRSAGVRWQQFINDMRVLGLELGMVVLPAMLAIVQPLMNLVKWFNNLDEGTKRTYGQFLAGAAAAALLLGVAASLTAGLVFLFKNLKIAAGAMGILEAETGSVVLSAALLTAGMAAAIVVIIKYHKQIESLTGGIVNLKEQIAFLATLFAAFKFVGVLTGLVKVTEAAGAAAGTAAVLRKRLLLLRRMGPIIITIAIEIVMHRKGIDKAVTGFLRKHGLGFLTGEQHKVADLLDPAEERKFVKTFGMDEYLKIVGDAAKKFPKTFGKALAGTGPLEGTLHGGPSDKARRKAAEFFAATDSRAKEHAKTIQEASISWKKLFNQVIAAQRVLHGKKLPSYKELLAYQNLLDKFQKASKGNQYSAAMEYLSALEAMWSGSEKTAKKHAKNLEKIQKEYERRARQHRKQEAQQAKQDIKSATSGIMQIYQESLQQYQGYLGTLFQGPFMSSAIMQNRSQFGFGARPQDLVRDMKESVGHARRFQHSLNRLRTRTAGVGGVTVADELTKQIAALGPEAQSKLDVIGKMSGKQFKEWVGYFQRGQQDAKIQANKDLQARLKEWMKFGKNVALAIASGVKSEDVALENALRSLIERMFPGLKARATLPPKGRGKGGMNLPGHVGETVNYHIHPSHDGKGWKADLKRAHFQQKNRKK